jgi:hypothetical protein
MTLAVSVGREAAADGDCADGAAGRDEQSAGAERTENIAGRARGLWATRAAVGDRDREGGVIYSFSQ